ncbi:FAD-dependent oxidoreductase [Geminicoccaceae bacterium 1502E]|nr:FAD-dependent oxidoreductase [Geminicoccaceae bacterium 1502E]
MRVIVVGAGLVGLSAAWWLARQGHEPVLLEQGPLPNPAASSFDRHRLIRLAHAAGDGRGRLIHEAYAAWERLWVDLGRSHYRETGMLVTGGAPGDWIHACRDGFDALGQAYDIWEPGELARRCPFLELAPGTFGLFTARGGALLTERIIADLLAWLAERGVAMRGDAQVVTVEPSRARAVLADGEQVEGDALILAAGAWTGRLLARLAPCLEPRRAVVLYLRPPPDIAQKWASSPCFLDFGGTSDIYLVPPLDGMDLKFGAGAHSRPGDPAAPRRLEAGEPEELLHFLRPHIRELDRYQVTDAKVCFTCYSPDQAFIAGGLEGRTVYATGCSGQMAKFSAVMGRRLAEAATGAFDPMLLPVWTRGGLPPAAAA